jgi:hypothetical protein
MRVGASAPRFLAAAPAIGSSNISALTVLQLRIKLFSRLIAMSFSIAYMSLLSPNSHQNAWLLNRNGATEKNVIFLVDFTPFLGFYALIPKKKSRSDQTFLNHLKF